MAQPSTLTPLLLLLGAGALVAVAVGSQSKIGGETDSDGGDTSLDDLPPPPPPGTGIGGDGSEVERYNFIPGIIPEPGLPPRAPTSSSSLPKRGESPKEVPQKEEDLKFDGVLCYAGQAGQAFGPVSKTPFQVCDGVNQTVADSLQKQGWFPQGQTVSNLLSQISILGYSAADFAKRFDRLADVGALYVTGRLKNSATPAQLVYAWNAYMKAAATANKLNNSKTRSLRDRKRSEYNKLADAWRWAGLLYLIAIGER